MKGAVSGPLQGLLKKTSILGFVFDQKDASHVLIHGFFLLKSAQAAYDWPASRSILLVRTLPSQSQSIAPQRKRRIGINRLINRSTRRRCTRYATRLHTG